MFLEASTAPRDAPGNVVYLVSLPYAGSYPHVGFPILLEMEAENFNGFLSWDRCAVDMEAYKVSVCFGFSACFICNYDVFRLVGRAGETYSLNVLVYDIATCP